MVAYTAFRGYYLVNRLAPGIAKTSLIRPPEEDISFRPQDTGFDFAFGLGKGLDPTIGFFSVKFMRQTVDNGERIKNRTDLKFERCGSEHFNYVDQAEVKKYGINNYTCVTDDNYEIFGNFYREEMTYLEIKLWKCQNATSNPNYTTGVTPGVTCKSQ